MHNVVRRVKFQTLTVIAFRLKRELQGFLNLYKYSVTKYYVAMHIDHAGHVIPLDTKYAKRGPRVTGADSRKGIPGVPPPPYNFQRDIYTCT